MIQRWTFTTTMTPTAPNYASKSCDIVLVAVPDTSGRPGKVRPALVVSSDVNNRRLQDVVVVMITSTTVRAKLEPTQLLVELATPEGKQ